MYIYIYTYVYTHTILYARPATESPISLRPYYAIFYYSILDIVCLFKQPMIY